MTYTKGEWRATPLEQHCWLIESMSETAYREVATIHSYDKEYGVEAQANAHLIAAAPKMYETLKSLALADIDPIYRKITVEVIAKAEHRDV